MTFDEEFPSLQGHHVYGSLNEKYMPLWAIKEHCLDKQRVIEAFMNCVTIWDYETALKQLIKEREAE